jgi:hypothetical protein
MVACAPVALFWDMLDVQYDASRDVPSRGEFQAGANVAQSTGPRYFALMSVARWACIPFCLLGATICFLWARDLYGSRAGLLATGLWVFCPNVLAHGHLITPDVGATALGAAASYAFWRWLRSPTWLRAVVAGLVLGLAELSKSTWVVLFALWPVLWMAYRWSQRAEREPVLWRRESVQLGAALLLALWVLNLGYGFEGSFKRLGEYRFVSHALGGPAGPPRAGELARNRFAGTWVGALPVPLPENYLSGIDVQKADFEGKMWSYLRGEWRRGGWWYYYLYAMLVKVPLGTWVVFGLAVALTLFRRGYSVPLRDELVLWLPLLAVLALVSSQTGFNHHLRYVLPVFPFMFIWMSKVARSIELRDRAVAVAAGIALAWSVTSSLLVYPHSLSYYNELAGGPKGGHWHLANSNTDWGQDLLYLKRWLDAHPDAKAKPLYLAYDMPLVDPRLAGIEYKLPPVDPRSRSAPRLDREVGPRPGWHVISVNELHRRDGAYRYFLEELEPAARVGYSMNIYHVTPEQAYDLRQKLGAAPASRP